MNDVLKKIIDDCVDMSVTVLKAAEVDLGEDPKGAIKFEMAAFAMLISGMDSKIVFEEAKTICDYFDVIITPENIANVIQEMDLMSKEFVENPPMCLRALVAGDNFIFESGKTISPWATEALFNAYKGIAVEMVNADGEADKNEVGVANLYLNMMADFIKENLKVGYVPE